MQKIMFNDKYGITQAVLNGTKTQTRRILKGKPLLTADDVEDSHVVSDVVQIIANAGKSLITCKLPYKVGEIVAVAQRNKNANIDFVPIADVLPHQIRITNVRVERLQDISDEDCIKEGIVYLSDVNKFYFEDVKKEAGFYFNTPREAYADLIDKISGKGTWDSNPWVFCYEFELVK